MFRFSGWSQNCQDWGSGGGTGAHRQLEDCSGSQAGARTARTGGEQELLGSLETVFRFSGWSLRAEFLLSVGS